MFVSLGPLHWPLKSSGYWRRSRPLDSRRNQATVAYSGQAIGLFKSKMNRTLLEIMQFHRWYNNLGATVIGLKTDEENKKPGSKQESRLPSPLVSNDETLPTNPNKQNPNIPGCCHEHDFCHEAVGLKASNNTNTMKEEVLAISLLRPLDSSFFRLGTVSF